MSGRRLEFWIPIGVLALDQATKALVRATLSLHENVEVIPGLFDITHVRNTGAAFGLFNTADFPYKTAVLALIAAAALVAVGAYAATLPREHILPRVGLSLILGGAAGNLIDRLAAGFVVDFVDVYWRDYHFWAFNVADSAITVGVAIMILDTIGVGTHVSKTV
jgi:signal peptidase II